MTKQEKKINDIVRDVNSIEAHVKHIRKADAKLPMVAWAVLWSILALMVICCSVFLSIDLSPTEQPTCTWTSESESFSGDCTIASHLVDVQQKKEDLNREASLIREQAINETLAEMNSQIPVVCNKYYTQLIAQSQG